MSGAGEHDIARLKRANKVLALCNRALISASNETSLLDEICRIVVEDCGYRLAWVGYAEDGRGRKVRPVAQSGFEQGYLDKITITWDDSDTGRGPTGTAICTGQPVSAHNILSDPTFAPWRDEALKHGLASSLALPLIADSRTLGALSIYAPEPDAFDAEEEQLLLSMADNLAFGIVTIRGREERVRSVEELKATHEDWHRIFNSITDSVMILDLDQNILVANPATEKKLDMSIERIVGHKCYELFHNLDEAAAGCPFKALIKTGGAVEIEEMQMDAVGGIYLVTVAPIYNDEGKLSRVLHIARDITERKLTEERLQQSEMMYRAIFEATGTATMIVDEDTTIVMTNRECLRVTGYTQDELIGTKWTGYVAPESLGLMLKYQKARREDPASAPSEYEVKLINREGQVRATILKVVLVPETGQSVVSLLDITERKQAEEQLHRVEERFRLAFQTSPDAININRLEDGLYIDINDGFTATTGYTREEVIGKTSLELNIWDDPADRDRLVAGLKMDGQVNNMEAGFRMKDGRVITALMSAKIISLDDVPCILSITRNIEDIKQAEAALRESEAKLRAIFENSRDAIGVTRAGVLVWLNPAYVRLFGYEHEDQLIGTSVMDLVTPDERSKVMEYVRLREERGEAPAVYETQGLKKDGSGFDMEVSTSTHKLDNEQNTVVMLRDISEHKVLEENLRQAHKMESIGRLAGGVAHDFNNLLTAIEGYIDLTLLDLPQGGVERENLLEARLAVERATNLTRQLLLFGRREHAELRNINLNTIVTEMLKILKRLVGEHYSLVSNLRDDLAPVKADAGQIEQVLMNLVVNARDAMEDGGIIEIGTSQVQVEEAYVQSHIGARKGRFVRLFVSDKGDGIAVDTLAHIFEPFFTTKQMGRGTGLGLSVVYGIVIQHEGWIDVESVPGSGSTLSVFLPVATPESSEVDVRSVPAEALRGNGEKILLIEDEDSVRVLAERILSSHNYSVVAAASAEDALDLFEAAGGDFDLVFSDVILPGMNGIALIERLIELKPGLRVLLASGFVEDAGFQTILDQGFRLMEKPYAMIDLLKQVRKLLEEE